MAFKNLVPDSVLNHLGRLEREGNFNKLAELGESVGGYLGKESPVM